jgi:hypothetical protein
MKNDERSPWIALLTGTTAVALGVLYLLLVQILDWRGMLQPITEF